jgi:hypothetical protein
MIPPKAGRIAPIRYSQIVVARFNRKLDIGYMV